MKEMPFGARVSMEPAVLRLAYSLQGGARRACEFALPFAPWDALEAGGVQELALGDDDVAVSVSFDGEVLALSATPVQPCAFESCAVELRHAFASDEAVLMNGYQSWTDAIERPAWARMRGLRGTPSRLVKRFALDGGGDYGFVNYSAKRGQQHGFSYATFRRGEGMVLVGSLDEARGFTLMCADASRGVVSVQPECPPGFVSAGEAVVLLEVAIVRGTRDACFDHWFELMGVSARAAGPLVGYTSWYRHYGNIDEAALSADLAGAKAFFDELSPAQLHGLRKLFQIDDGFCKVGDWLHVDRSKFPDGLAPLAERIREAGFVPGLWLAPFVCEADSRLFAQHPDWLLRDGGGSPVATGCQWSGGFALDVRNAEVRSYVADVLRTVTQDWGFKLIKLDFLYAACMIPHDGCNRGQLMADAVRLLRESVGDDVLILGCGVPLASAFGVFDYCRIGCDVGLDWDDAPHMRTLHRERVSTKNSLANTYGRSPLDGRAFGNDPDVFFLRDDVKLTRAQRAELLDADARHGRVLLTSDDMGAWTFAMRESYLKALEVFARS